MGTACGACGDTTAADGPALSKVLAVRLAAGGAADELLPAAGGAGGAAEAGAAVGGRRGAALVAPASAGAPLGFGLAGSPSTVADGSVSAVVGAAAVPGCADGSPAACAGGHVAASAAAAASLAGAPAALPRDGDESTLTALRFGEGVASWAAGKGDRGGVRSTLGSAKEIIGARRGGDSDGHLVASVGLAARLRDAVESLSLSLSLSTASWWGFRT